MKQSKALQQTKIPTEVGFDQNSSKSVWQPLMDALRNFDDKIYVENSELQESY